MARRNRADSHNFDSLLDTMANVVGILVVMLAVTQISVGDAMRRLVEVGSEDVKAVTLEESERETAALVGLLGQRRSELAEVEEMLALGQSEIGGLLPYAGELAGVAGDGEQKGLSLAGLEALIARRRSELSAIAPELVEVRTKMAAYEQERAIPDLDRAEVKISRLPDTRPAPAGARFVDWFCRYDRVFRPELETLLQLRETEMRRAVDAPVGAIPLLEADRARLASHFDAYDIGNDSLRWRFVDLGRRGLLSRLDWRSRQTGESARELALPNSTFHAELESLDPRSTVMRFHVWSDSFDAYLQARSVAADAGFSAGWLPYDRAYDPQMNMLSPPPPLPRVVD
jgi:hypothetical protein